MDLIAVSRVPVEQIQRIGELIGTETGLLPFKRLHILAKSAVSDQNLARSVANTVYGLPPEQTESVLASLERYWQANPGIYPELTSNIFSALRKRLEVLRGPYLALDRTRKAERLERLTGNWVDDIEILCDLRPVFNETRERVEALVPIQTMRIAYIDIRGNDAIFEICLDKASAEEMKEKLEVAKQKIDVLRKTCGEWLPRGWAGSDPE